MNLKIIFLVSIFLVISVAFAQDPPTISLVEGNNTVMIESFFYPIYASTLIERYPQIQSITLYEYGESVGYVNIFGGIGRNFVIQSKKVYEIHVSQDVNLTLG